MNLIKKIIIISILVIVFYYTLYFMIVYSDVIFSLGMKEKLRGKIIYSSQGHYINIIEFPSGQKKCVYSVSRETNGYPASVLSPSFSPSGRMIVFSKADYTASNFRYKLWIMNSDGTDLRKLLELDDRYLLSPSWSPNERQIAFIVRNSQRGGIGGLYVVDVDKPISVICISNILPSPIQPAWLPDNKRIIFNSEELFRKQIKRNIYSETDQGGIYIANTLNKDCRKLVSLASEFCLSPDGTKLVYDGRDGYYLANLINESVYNSFLIIPYKKPFFGEGGSFPVRWSPDGKYLVFCKEIWPGIAGIYVISIDDPGRQIRISTDNAGIIGMSWAD